MPSSMAPKKKAKAVKEETKDGQAVQQEKPEALLPAPASAPAMAPMIPRNLNKEQVELIKRTICVGGTDDELALFIANCNRTQLDPFARQIYAVKRWNSDAGKYVMTTQISVDGSRIIAQRSSMYRGQTKTEWCGEDGVWKDVWLSKESPAAARVGVHHAKFAEPLYAVARFESYAQTKKEGGLTHMWKTKGDIMIAKCAEVLALRKAFPQDLSGLYTSEEMGTETVEYEVKGEEDKKFSRGFDALMKMVESPKVTASQLAELHQKMNDSDKYSEAQKNAFNEEVRKRLDSEVKKDEVNPDPNASVDTIVQFTSQEEEKAGGSA